MTVTELLSDTDIGAAKKLASEADIALVFVNANSGEEFITVEGHKGDRNHLNLWHDGDRLVITACLISPAFKTNPACRLKQ
jgi:beta-glucosidase